MVSFNPLFCLIVNFLNTDDKYNNVDKDNSDNVNDDNEDKKKNLMDKLGPIDVLFNTLRNIKRLCISHIIFNSNNDTVQVIEEEDTLILYSYSDNGDINNGDQEPKYQAQYYAKNKGPHIFIQGNHELKNTEEINNEGSGESSNNKGNQKPKQKLPKGNRESSSNKGNQEPKRKLSEKNRESSSLSNKGTQKPKQKLLEG